MPITCANWREPVAGSQPILRVRGELERVKYDPLDSDELKGMLYEIAPEFKVKIFEETGDVDFGWTRFPVQDF